MLNQDYTFGIEIEFKGARLSTVAAALNDAGIRANVRGYGSHAPLTSWKLTTDATVTSRGYNYRSGEGIGGELVSPILKGENGLAKLTAALDVLNSIDGVNVDRACGIHVHLGRVDGWKADHAKNIYSRYAAFETDFDSFMARSRRGTNGHYCRSLARFASQVAEYTGDSLQGLLNRGGGKFMKVNLSTLTRNNNGTVEFRHHNGSTDPIKLTNWVRLLIAFADASKTVSSGAATGSHDYKAKRKSTTYAALREQVEAHGGSFKYAGGKNWKISGANGVERDWISEELNDLYIDGGFDLDAEKFSTFWAMTFGNDPLEADHIFKDVESAVVDFFRSRIAHFANA